MINQADEDDTIYRVATPSVTKGGKGKDFILLASRRKPCDSRCVDMTLLASRDNFALHFNKTLCGLKCLDAQSSR